MDNTQGSIFKVTLPKSKNDKSVFITLGGDLSLKEIDKLKNSFSKILNDYSTFNIKVESVENIDLGFIQLIKLFVGTAAKQGKIVKYEFDLSNEHMVLLENAGLHEFINKQ